MSHNILKFLLIISFITSLSYKLTAQTERDILRPIDNLTQSSYSEYSVSGNKPDFRIQQDSTDYPSGDSLIRNSDIPVANNINLTRLGIVSGVSLAILGGIYYRMKTAWWNDGTTGFHIYYNYTYIDNVDKVGHLYGGALFTECFGAGLRWAGFDEESSLLYGAIFSTMIYTGIEIKDGYAPEWGFDPADLGTSVLGAFYPYAQKKIPFLQGFNFKYSYFPSNSQYYKDMNKESRNNQFFNDDYEGQTFWLTANLKSLLPEKINSFIPDFLNIALGVSVENLADASNKHRVFILSPDLELTKLFKTDNELLSTFLRLLNYIHFPLPALRISPDFKAYPVYLKP